MLLRHFTDTIIRGIKSTPLTPTVFNTKFQSLMICILNLSQEPRGLEYEKGNQVPGGDHRICCDLVIYFMYTRHRNQKST